MPPLFGQETRKLVKARQVIPGPKSLHRGIHFDQNQDAVLKFKTNATAKRNDHRELLVHHQKVNEELQDIYARTASLDKENMTMEQRIEQSWKNAERIGVRRPKAKVGFAAHLEALEATKRDERQRMEVERTTSGETYDYSNGSALHDAKDRRIRNFQKRQLKRAHMLKRMGDPTPLKQSGRFDQNSATLNVFNKTVRKVKREVAHDHRIHEVKTRKGKNAKSMWDVRGGNENINRPSTPMVRYTREFELGSGRPNKKRRSEK
ncbi:Hypothetical protein, putative [Bodo saltans]|uniref:Uncharacterized protein n=1 Tax=Bodo saltans TaxID=75058 RepID=A0A0S4JUY7_BODSA|nr:Hypothetical protein, putative [Bodo saltans]|eukprot:CUG93199.1 Hypothetical protein, putative [Bodo saltans]